jgi:hypothetical protein
LVIVTLGACSEWRRGPDLERVDAPYEYDHAKTLDSAMEVVRNSLGVSVVDRANGRFLTDPERLDHQNVLYVVELTNASQFRPRRCEYNWLAITVMPMVFVAGQRIDAIPPLAWRHAGELASELKRRIVFVPESRRRS